MIDLNKLEERIAHAKAEILFMGMEPEEMEELTALIRRQEAALKAERASTATLTESMRNLALDIWRDEYKAESTKFEVLPDAAGILSQIDNMVCGMARAALPATGVVTDDRAAFEAWAVSDIGNWFQDASTFTKRENGDYVQRQLQAESEAFAAGASFARAILAAQTQAVAAPDALRSAGHAVVQLALDNACDHVHVCDQNDDLVKIKVCSDEIQALYAALAAAPAQAAAPDAMAELHRQIMNLPCHGFDHAYKEGHRHARIAAAKLIAAAQPEAKAAPAKEPTLPTDLSQRLRAKACQPFGPEDFALLTQAADEIERYYGGMMAWKQTAEKKDADWNAERMGRVDDRIAARKAAPAPSTQPEIEVSVDYLHCRHVAPIKRVVRTDGRISVLVESLPAPATMRAMPVIWEHCPECGSMETDPPQEGCGYFCANCGQEWHGDIDYSEVVRKNLERLAAAGNSQSPSAPDAVAAAQGDAGNSQDAKDAAWLPIETAPSDGSHVLCYAPELQFSGFYAGRSGWCYVAPGVPVAPTQPTHWMPLPAAPVAAPSPAEGA